MCKGKNASQISQNVLWLNQPQQGRLFWHCFGSTSIDAHISGKETSAPFFARASFMSSETQPGHNTKQHQHNLSWGCAVCQHVVPKDISFQAKPP